MDLNIKTLEIELGDVWWITLLSFETRTQTRSLFHIEYGYGIFKLQFLFLKNNCWVFGDI